MLLIPAVTFPFLTQTAFAADSSLTRAASYFKAGRYSEALEQYQMVQGADRVAGVIGASRTWAMIGQYAEAEAICRKALGEVPAEVRLSVQLAEILAITGRRDGAMGILEPIASAPRPMLRGMVKYGQLLEMRGRREEAAAVFQRAIARYRDGLVFDAQDLAMVAAASRELEDFHFANRLFREALREDPSDLEAEVMWGDLFREKYNMAEARKSYGQVLQRNERYVPALVGLAKTTGGSPARELLEQALQINPRSETALEALAEMALEDDRLDAALGYLAAILDFNPESLNGLTLKAAIVYLQEERAEYDAIQKRLAQNGSAAGRFYARIAEICGRKYRFDEAVQLARQAVAIDPELWSAYQLLGINLLRLGREAEGRAHLELAFEKDPFNFWTMNMLEVLDTLDGFETRRTGHFIVRMSRLDADSLWPYLEPLLDEAWTKLTAKYGFEPAGPILVEVFADHQDFAVRTAGLPDIGPLVGVCFGKVITLDSPQALKSPHSMNWQEVVWHEFTHVITLQMANNRLPRWLSEGISVYEEKFGRSEWGRRQNLDLVRAVQEERILPIKTLNEGFTKADSSEDLGFAYYQSSLVVEYIVQRYGFESLKALIYRYRTPMNLEDIFHSVFYVSVASFEEGFRAWLSDRVRQIDVYVRQEDPARRNRENESGIGADPPAPALTDKAAAADVEEALRSHLEQQPRDFQARLQLGMLLYEKKDYDGAIIHLKAARDLLPEYGDIPNPRQILADIYESRGDETAMLRELETLVRYRQNDFDACYKLALAYRRQQNHAKVVYFLERAIAVNPYDLDVHRMLAATTFEKADYQRAIREYSILTALEVTDPAGAYASLGRAYLSNGQKKQAKTAALAALEIAPTFERAQTVLLESLEPADL